MGILQRVFEMTKAVTNDMLDKLENPVTMMNHYLRDLDEKLADAERAIVEQQAQERMLMRKHEELNSQAALYEKQAEQAASEAREVEARTAIEAMLRYKEEADETARFIELSRETSIDLELRIEALQEEKSKLQAKRTELMSRLNRSQSKAEYHLQGSSSVEGFERIERKVMEWEAQSELGGMYPDPYRHVSYNSAAVDPKQEQRNLLVEEHLQRLMQKV
ncbi:PspA/IM30 family protein [Paenibacillus camelliae]|uniref:PspA/IM30 family protein n=1 Tax=Paenibacillus camelliae TaxID=512410 RepID=UPI00203BCB40|nr:PspA/IM30 family protein [Paenibacillus camelliae]MCM3634127.1 PspA/IM30 family protein [Paenibacillus camelliae]